MTRYADSPAQVVNRSGTTATVAVSGEIDIANAAQLRTCLTGCLADGYTDITLDVEKLTFIDASALSVLAYVAKSAKAHQGRLTLQKPVPLVRRVLNISGLADLVDLTDPDSDLEPPAGHE